MGRIKEVKRASFNLLWDGEDGWRVQGMNTSAQPALSEGLLIHDMVDHVLMSRRVPWPVCELEQELLAVGSWIYRYGRNSDKTALLVELVDLSINLEIDSVRPIKEPKTTNLDLIEFEEYIEHVEGSDKLWSNWVNRGARYASALYPNLANHERGIASKSFGQELLEWHHHHIKISIDFSGIWLPMFRIQSL